MWQLAYEIDRDADDQNEYLDNMVRTDSLYYVYRYIYYWSVTICCCQLIHFHSKFLKVVDYKLVLVFLFRTQTSWVQLVCWVAVWSASPLWSDLGGTTAAFCATCLRAWSWLSSCSTTWSPGYSADVRPSSSPATERDCWKHRNGTEKLLLKWMVTGSPNMIWL